MVFSRRITFLALFTIILIAALAYFVIIPQLNKAIHPVATPFPLYDYSLSVLNPQVTEVSGYNGFYTISQGMPLKINITLNSTTDQPITIPIENLTVSYYNSTVNLHSWINSNDNYSSIQQQAFNYSFSQNQLTLQPFMSNSTLLTINLAQNAPLGQYSILIHFGNVQATNIMSYAQTIGLEMVIIPRTT